MIKKANTNIQLRILFNQLKKITQRFSFHKNVLFSFAISLLFFIIIILKMVFRGFFGFIPNSSPLSSTVLRRYTRFWLACICVRGRGSVRMGRRKNAMWRKLSLDYNKFSEHTFVLSHNTEKHLHYRYILYIRVSMKWG